MLESIRPELRQYFLESDTEAAPCSLSGNAFKHQDYPLTQKCHSSQQ